MVLQAALVATGRPGGQVATPPSAAAAWPCYIAHLPNKPDQAMCCYDTQGTTDGRLMGNGHYIRHPGWQVRLRAYSYAGVVARAKLVQARLEAILREQVDVDGVTYTITNVTQRSDILPMGQEPEGQRRDEVTLNGTITFHKA